MKEPGPSEQPQQSQARDARTHLKARMPTKSDSTAPATEPAACDASKSASTATDASSASEAVCADALAAASTPNTIRTALFGPT